MPQMPGVRVAFSYVDENGEWLDPRDYLDEITFEEYAFAEDVTKQIITSTLAELLCGSGLPDGVIIHWAITDTIPRGVVH